MRIPKKLLDQWDELKSSSDAAIIAENANVSKQSVYYAFSKGSCKDELFEAMAAYYQEKKERVDAFLTDNQE
jgi:predicted DNA-binding protein YlxM (UPF0122 family)